MAFRKLGVLIGASAVNTPKRFERLNTRSRFQVFQEAITSPAGPKGVLSVPPTVAAALGKDTCFGVKHSRFLNRMGKARRLSGLVAGVKKKA
jgi:hypothetical protein